MADTMTMSELYKYADYKGKHGMLYRGDCMGIMQRIGGGTVDLIVTDPPYLMNYQSHRRKTLYDKIDNDCNAEELIFNYMQECDRILKNNSAIYMFCSWHHVDLFKVEFEKYFKLKNILIWNKNNHGSGDLKASYAPKYEMVLYGNKGRSEFRNKRISDVIDCPKVSGASSMHPTQKPVELLSAFIENNSDEGQIVFDGFMGSGSTCVACINTNRRYIGIELNDQYFDIAKERIEESENING